MKYKVSKNQKYSSRNDKLIEQAEGVYDNIDKVMDVLGNLLVVDLPDGSMLLYDVNTTDGEIDADMSGRYAVGIVELVKQI
jgi:hypothetical protein